MTRLALLATGSMESARDLASGAGRLAMAASACTWWPTISTIFEMANVNYFITTAVSPLAPGRMGSAMALGRSPAQPPAHTRENGPTESPKAKASTPHPLLSIGGAGWMALLTGRGSCAFPTAWKNWKANSPEVSPTDLARCACQMAPPNGANGSWENLQDPSNYDLPVALSSGSNPTLLPNPLLLSLNPFLNRF